MVEGSTTPKESSSNFRGKLLFKRAPNSTYSLREGGWGGEEIPTLCATGHVSFMVSPQ